MRLEFTKMHGLGNDFMVIDLVSQRMRLSPEQIRQLADRHFGVGFDQLLVVEPPETPDVDFCYRIFNADGSEVQQCGNGARCFARFVRERRLTRKDHLRVETASGIIELSIDALDCVSVNMGAPRFAPADIPFVAEAEALVYSVQVNGQAVELSTVNMGNPHAVLLVDNVETADVATLGPALESHARFPERVNVGFLQVVDRHHARLRVFERGTGETLACGTGACAAVVAGIRRGLLDSPVKVALSGGELNIHWAGVGEPVIMIGPTARVYDGVIRLPDVAMPEPQDCGQDRPRGPRPGGSRNKKKDKR
ncbi:MAG: diaminopimelate epimerase [Moraxellaceae bacterium]|nr:diaminopimelate epimerase [Moraxellaceae bacterium]MBP7229165.1 diaminopimelate epimerase [Moraxellaceae bacterium]MBP9045529.1 diaminopimelate epimerase [Moraxellaceae bacterium]MBP9731267.1 diaminopimelate epimerase [Moraxellaceae bacterium]MCC6199332.1 diaminopimelate epimerase [Moraxellaceae bacterium]